MADGQSQEACTKTKTGEDDKFKYKAAAFLTGVAGASIIGGFGMTLGMAKKKDPNMFNKGMMGAKDLHVAGGTLAMRALGIGTLYAVTGFSIFCFGVWKLMGAQNLHEFRAKAGGLLPRIPKNDPPQGRTEFENLTDFLQYVIDEDAKKKLERNKVTDT